MVGFTVTLALMMGLVSLPIWISTSRDWLKHFKKKFFLQRWEEEMYCMLSTRWRRWLFHQVVQQGHMVGGTFLGSHLFHCEWVASPCVNNLHWFTISSLPSWTTLEHISLCVHGEDCIVIVSRFLVCAWRRLPCYSQSEWEASLFQFTGAADVRNVWCTVFLQLTKFFDRKGASVVLCCRTPLLCVCVCVCFVGGGGGAWVTIINTCRAPHLEMNPKRFSVATNRQQTMATTYIKSTFIVILHIG